MKIQPCRETSVSCRRSWLSRTFYAVKRGFITDFRLSPGGGETAGYESSAPCRSNVKWLPPGGKGWRVFRSGDENCDCAKSVPIYFHRSVCVRSPRLHVEALRELLSSRYACHLPPGGRQGRALIKVPTAEDYRDGGGGGMAYFKLNNVMRYRLKVFVPVSVPKVPRRIGQT